MFKKGHIGRGGAETSTLPSTLPPSLLPFFPCSITQEDPELQVLLIPFPQGGAGITDTCNHSWYQGCTRKADTLRPESHPHIPSLSLLREHSSSLKGLSITEGQSHSSLRPDRRTTRKEASDTGYGLCESLPVSTRQTHLMTCFLAHMSAFKRCMASLDTSNAVFRKEKKFKEKRQRAHSS